MSDDIPIHVQEEIMTRLPVKSLIRFRSVSKTWKSLIDSSKFIASHSLHRHTQQQYLLVSYENLIEESTYISFVDDHTFPQQRSVSPLPIFIKQLIRPRVVGSSHGLICIYGYNSNFRTNMSVLWNPSIRKSVAVAMPKQPCIGFGVCPLTNDPKIVSIAQSWDDLNVETSYRCKVRVYSLSSRKWRNLSTNLPTKPVSDDCFALVTDRFIYWRPELSDNMIMSFDVTNEKFEEIDFPNSLYHDCEDLYTSKLRGSLVMLQYKEDTCSVWMMEHGVRGSFTKLFTIETPHEVVGFRKNGVPIIQVIDEDDEEHSQFVVCEPNSEQNNVLEIYGSPYSFFLHSYMETLLLLDRRDCISY